MLWKNQIVFHLYGRISDVLFLLTHLLLLSGLLPAICDLLVEPISILCCSELCVVVNGKPYWTVRVYRFFVLVVEFWV